MPHLNAAQAVHKPMGMVFIPEEHPVRVPLLLQEGIPWKQICIVEISSSLSWRAHLPRAFRYDCAFWLLKALVACLSRVKMCVRGSGTQTVRNATWVPFTAELSGTLNFQRCLPDPLFVYYCMIPRLFLCSQHAAKTRPVQHKGNKAVFWWGVLLTELTDPHSFIFQVGLSVDPQLKVYYSVYFAAIRGC